MGTEKEAKETTVTTASPEDELPAIKICRKSGKDKLDLSHNQLTLSTLPQEIFDLSHLQYLYLEGNGIKEVPPELCKNLTRLLWLDLRRNALESLPTNISSLSKLKNLLLEGNQIKRLPLELGLLTNLTGLNLRNNPLSFPPQDIISLGTKEILRYLREYDTLSIKNPDSMVGEGETLGAPEGATDPPSNRQQANEVINENKLMEKFQKFPVGVYADALDDISDSGRRMSLEENMIQLLRYSVNPLEIKERSKSFPKYTLPSLGTKNLFLDNVKDSSKRSNSPKCQVPGEEMEGSPHYTSTKSTLRDSREVTRAALRRFNEKTDKTLQARKNKKMLDEWRKRNSTKNRKSVDRKKKHEIVIPYGHTPLTQDNKAENETETKVPNPKFGYSKSDQRSELKMSRLSLDEELDSRIKEHVQNIKNWRRKQSKNAVNLEDELSATTKNLEKAHQLQKELHDNGRGREYRFQAFTGGEYVPAAHPQSVPVEK